jgi:hypothetical protein
MVRIPINGVSSQNHASNHIDAGNNNKIVQTQNPTTSPATSSLTIPISGGMYHEL